MLTQTAMTLLFGTAADGQVPNLGASGAIAAVLGAYFVLYPGSRVRTYIIPVFLVSIPAWIFLGLWFVYQLIEANFGLQHLGQRRRRGVLRPRRRVRLRRAGSRNPHQIGTNNAPREITRPAVRYPSRKKIRNGKGQGYSEGRGKGAQQ